MPNKPKMLERPNLYILNIANPHQSQRVQKGLFDLGYSWSLEDKNFKFLLAPSLAFCPSDASLSFGSACAEVEAQGLIFFKPIICEDEAEFLTLAKETLSCNL